MKKGIHPENYRLVAFKDMSNEDVFLAKSTANTNETIDTKTKVLLRISFMHFTSFIFKILRAKLIAL